MVQVSDIGWGAYGGFEGPLYKGSIPFQLPPTPDFLDKALLVITTTEGGRFDAINAYDRCIISVGLIQFCERVFNFSAILGRCAEMDNFMLNNFLKSFPCAIEFKKNPAGVWRFFFQDEEVTTEAQQRMIFLGGSSVGPKGSWNDDLKNYAKSVAACIANIWGYPLFRTVQAESTKSRLMGFVLPSAKAAIFSDTSPGANYSWPGALRAMYLSFAANNPTIANKALMTAASAANWGVDVQSTFLQAAQALTFGPGITIYPARYNAIAPVLNKTFGISAPLTADALKTWTDTPPDHVVLSDADKAAIANVVQLQNNLATGQDPALDALGLGGLSDGSGSEPQGDS